MDLESHPTTLQEENRKKVHELLKSTHSRIEKLIQKTYQQKDSAATSQLRQLRTRITGLVSEAEKKELDSFGSHEGNIDDFYENEERFVETSRMLLQEVENALATGESIDVFTISDLVDKIEMGFSHRIELTSKNLSEYENRIVSKKQAQREERERQEKELREQDQKEAEEKAPAEDKIEMSETSETFPSETKTNPADDIEDETSARYDIQAPAKKSELDTETLSKLYRYINTLEQKFEKQHPEVSYNGEYIADKQWKVELSKRSVRGSIKEGRFKTPMLIVDNYWKSIDDKREIIEMIQAKANTIEQNQYMSLCFINSSWDQSIKDWARTYSHQRLGFFLYDLVEDDLIYNETDENNRKFAFWHSSNGTRTKLTEIVDQLIEEEEYFDLGEVMEYSGLNLTGAKKFIDGLVKKKVLIDVGLGTPKYTRSK
ncbi:hypothetical protein LI82_05880 [Methanococcoides methylutens]|uniref:Uncharacterized protein n=1 Tax=Methanococcoides methylutens TaxID=2226 RepID=A0A099T3L8_METMT|nr:hypothetical protein [Methanococcoides methylutens]KGK98826.1 hypothetical protein LI82_05880 [Methanococcoides methylutens]